jgi:hypothetical protein
MNRFTPCALGVATAWLACAPAAAMQLQLHETTASFLAAAGPGVRLQDFESFAAVPVLNGIELLPGVTMSSNTSAVQRRVHARGIGARATHGEQPEMWLDTHLPTGTTAVAFDILYIDGGTFPATISVFFAPGVPGFERLDIEVTARSDDNFSSRDHFFGISGSVPIERVRYQYGLETDGILCCEEIIYDNLRVFTSPVPEPENWAMLLGGIGWLLWQRRRMVR